MVSREDVIRMQREAGWSGIYTQCREPDGSPDWTPVKESLTVPVTMEQIERFFQAAYAAGAADERKRVRSAMKKAYRRMSAYLVAAERDKSFRAGFYAGFMASGEGWNGEYPFQDNDRPVIGDPLVEAALTAALASRGDA